MLKSLLRFDLSALGARQMQLILNLYPPYLGAGIRVVEAAADFRAFTVEMPLTRYNRNYVGTHFGGSLYSMCDPFFMLMLIRNLGPDYLVWDKAAAIRFLSPGRGRVRARFAMSEVELADIRQRVEAARKTEPTFTVQVRDDAGEVVAEVDKTLYVRKKREARRRDRAA